MNALDGQWRFCFLSLGFSYFLGTKRRNVSRERLTVRALEEDRDEVRQGTKGRVDVNRRGERRWNRRGDWYITGLGCIHAFWAHNRHEHLNMLPSLSLSCDFEVAQFAMEGKETGKECEEDARKVKWVVH